MDYTPLIARIAESAEKIALTPNPFWLQTIIPIISVIIGAAIGYWTSQRAIKRQVQITKDNQDKRKQLVFYLLKDEINLRWGHNIKKELVDICELKQLERLRRFSTVKFREDDLFIFRDVSLLFQEYFFLENEKLVSEIIYGFLLYKDLIDFNTTVNRFLVDYEREKKKIETFQEKDEVEAILKKKYADIISTLSSSYEKQINKIKSEFQSILDKIEI